MGEPTDIDALRKLFAECPGRWAEDDQQLVHETEGRFALVWPTNDDCAVWSPKVLKLVLAMRNTLPQLLDELTEKRAEVESKNRLLPSLIAEGKQIEMERALKAERELAEARAEVERLRAYVDEEIRYSDDLDEFIRSRCEIVGRAPEDDAKTALATLFADYDALRAKPEASGVVVGSPAHVALWDAINGLVFSCGGDASSTNVGRQIAVVAVESALEAMVKQPEASGAAALREAVRAMSFTLDWFALNPTDCAKYLREALKVARAALAASSPEPRGGGA